MAKVIVFDFDKTLINYDTTLPFFLFCCENQGKRYLSLAFYLFIKLLSKCKVISVKKEKEVGLKLFCPENITDFNNKCIEFSKTIVFNKLYDNIFAKISILSENKIVIASASFQYYLECLFPNFKIIGTTLLTDKRGKIIGINSHPFKEEKVQRLQNEGFHTIDDFYTDSLNDVPTTTISHHVFYIKKGEILN